MIFRFHCWNKEGTNRKKFQVDFYTTSSTEREYEMQWGKYPLRSFRSFLCVREPFFLCHPNCLHFCVNCISVLLCSSGQKKKWVHREKLYEKNWCNKIVWRLFAGVYYVLFRGLCKNGFYDRKGLVGCSQMGTTILNWRNSEICKCICIGYGVFVEKWPWFGLFVDGFNIFPIFWLTEI